MEAQKKLRMITYMTPSYPLELYQAYQYYLEEVLGCQSHLIVESRYSGPPSGQVDPFTADEVDIGFVCSSSYLMLSEQNQSIELLPVTAVHNHLKNAQRPIYFSEVIILKEKADKYRLFHDLKGHKWAYNDELSLSGNYAVLAELKKNGTNASFFGHIMHSGSHFESIQMVLNSVVDSAAIDSNVLHNWFVKHPKDKDRLHILCSLGPLPTPPVVVNSRLSGDVKQKIAAAFLAMSTQPKWQEALQKHNVHSFTKIDSTLYDKEKDIKDIVKDQSLHTTYY